MKIYFGKLLIVVGGSRVANRWIWTPHVVELKFLQNPYFWLVVKILPGVLEFTDYFGYEHASWRRMAGMQRHFFDLVVCL